MSFSGYFFWQKFILFLISAKSDRIKLKKTKCCTQVLATKADRDGSQDFL